MTVESSHSAHRRLPVSPSPRASSFPSLPGPPAPALLSSSRPPTSTSTLLRWLSPRRAGLLLLQLILLASAYHFLAPSLLAPAESAHRARAKRLVSALYDEQSTTLAQARARYSLKTGRKAPKGYDAWFAWCKERGLLVDSYDQVYQDVRPYYDLQSPSHVKRAIGKGILASDDDELRLVSFSSSQRGGAVQLRSRGDHDFIGFWSDILSQFNRDWPDFDVLLNWEDNSRVVFDYSDPANVPRAYDLDDGWTFKQWPHPASRFFKDEGRCRLRNSNQGLGREINDVSGFLVAPIQAGFTTDLIPLLTQNAIRPCFADIIIPSIYHMHKYGWGPQQAVTRPDTIPWESKKSVLYWRGQQSGGFLDGVNWRDFPRFRLVTLSNERPDLVDASFVFSYELCTTYDRFCKMIEEEFPITGKKSWAYGYNFKYVFDIDGHAFSGRFLGLLRSNSLVFKSTMWTEFFSHWLLPWVHFVPVLPDLSDLYEKVEWAIEHDDEARRIQAAGAEAVRRIMTDDQATAYFALVFMHIAELQNGWTWSNGSAVIDVKA